MFGTSFNDWPRTAKKLNPAAGRIQQRTTGRKTAGQVRHGADSACLPPYVLQTREGFVRHHTVKMRTKKEPFFIGE